jgi:hypothetical protein
MLADGARAASGRTAAALPSSVMKSRRLIAFSEAQDETSPSSS